MHAAHPRATHDRRMHHTTGFIRSLRARHASPTTLRNAYSALTMLERATGRPAITLTHDDIEQWVDDRLAAVTARTVRAQLVWVHGFYRWATAAGHLDVDPSARIGTVKVPRLLPRPIAEQRLDGALAAADTRMRAVLLLAADAGLRAAEIARLEWADVDLDSPEPTLRVVGKGSRERVVDLVPRLVAALADLGHRRGVVIRRADGGAGANTATRISQMASTHLHESGCPDTLHALRHRFGTLVCRAGGIRVAQEALGHASPTSTAIYTAIARREIRGTILAALDRPPPDSYRQRRHDHPREGTP